MRERRAWTDDELAVLRELYSTTITSEIARQLQRKQSTVYQKALKLGLSKSPEFFASDASGRLRKGTAFVGKAYRFKPGHTPANKGRKGGPPVSPGTVFKPGHRPYNYVPLGTERIRDGYLCRKVTETGVTTRDFVPVHRLVWETAHGPIPPGHAVAFKDRKRRLVAADITLDVLELVTKAQLMRENTCHQYGKEIAQLVHLRGAITRQINKRSRQHGE